MTKKELNRYHVICDLIENKLNGTEAAKKLRLSIRQTKRLKKRVKALGEQGIIHQSRGKPSNNKIPEKIIKQAINLLRRKYPDFKPGFAGEKLAKNHKIVLSSEKVRQIMAKEELWKPKPRRKNNQHRSWRPRKEHYGQMGQFDGSYEEWFEQRAPACCLLASIDDATGRITKAKFVTTAEEKNNNQSRKSTGESVISVFGFWQEYIAKQGKPLSIYLDKYSTYKNNHQSVLNDPKSLTQFERAMQDLEVKVIHAHSPQAKGRIERLFGTLQDRLIKELRLNKINNIEQANEFVEKVFIPEFNEKFAVQAKSKVDLHRKLNKLEKKNLNRIFSVQELRTINNDFTISYQKQWFQLIAKQPTLILRKDKVLVEQRISGEIFISKKDKNLNYIALPERPKKIHEKQMKEITALTNRKPQWKPPLNHPWRRQFILNKEQIKIKQRAQV